MNLKKKKRNSLKTDKNVFTAVSCPLDDHRNEQIINGSKLISSLTCNTS